MYTLNTRRTLPRLVSHRSTPASHAPSSHTHRLISLRLCRTCSAAPKPRLPSRHRSVPQQTKAPRTKAALLRLKSSARAQTAQPETPHCRAHHLRASICYESSLSCMLQAVRLVSVTCVASRPWSQTLTLIHTLFTHSLLLFPCAHPRHQARIFWCKRFKPGVNSSVFFGRAAAPARVGRGGARAARCEGTIAGVRGRARRAHQESSSA